MTVNLEFPGKRSRLGSCYRPAPVTPREVEDDMTFADDDVFGSNVKSSIRLDSRNVLRGLLPSKRDTIH